MAKPLVTSKPIDKQRAPHGYFLYSNGISRWGVGIWDGKDYPIMITKEQHEKCTVEEKLKIWEQYVKELQEKAKKENNANQESHKTKG